MYASSIADQRAELARVRPVADRRHRVLFVGRYAQGPTDIVASLKRALENLGHTVFHLDTDRHRDVLDVHENAKGGYGPVYVELPEIRQILDRFRPQVMVLCAGGLVLSEESVKQCRERGIVLVGMTLSDPDVQPSVIDHVSRFDYHTTNAKLALDRYEAAGIRNTLLLPFGIDREVALRTVDPAPDLQADVICIGHAPGRTDRHEVMAALADKFDVRVYGTGWPFPGAAPVYGERLLQAAAGGIFHINFPATRAGFTNVKCGVFESIATGGVLCTQVFDEMAGLFDYGTEIVGWHGPDDLAAQIRELLDDPERLEAMRRKAFHRLVSEHLYEHRWRSLFAAIMADIDSDSPRVGSERAAEIREILAEPAPVPRTILVSGFFGARNRGDDLLLESLTRPIETALPDAHVVVAASVPREVERTHGLQAFRRTDPYAADHWASRATAVVLGPGGLWHDYSIARAGGTAGIVTAATASPSHLVQLPALTVAHGGDFHVFGMGVGPLADEDAKAAVRLSGRLATSVVVRDSTSVELLKQIPGFGCEIIQAPDVVYAATLPAPEASADRRYLAVNLRPWDFDDVGHAPIRDALLEIADAAGFDIVGVPMQPSDAAVLEEVFAGVDRFTLLPSDASLEEFATTIAGAAAVVAMRLHTSLVAHRLGRPAVGLAYDPKVREHYLELGRGDFLLDLPVDGGKLADAVRSALQQPSIDDDAQTLVRRFESESRAALKALTDQLGGAQVRDVAIGMERRPATKDRVPFGWSAEHVVGLASGMISSGNLHDPARDVPFERYILPGEKGMNLKFAGRPQAGDFVSWQLPIPDPHRKGRRVELMIRSTARELGSMRGRIVYEVHVDARPVVRQDVATWNQRNSIWLALPGADANSHIEVRLVALATNDDPDWQPAIWVEGVRSRWWPGSRFQWSCSSPTAEALTSSDAGAGKRTPKASGSSGVPAGKRTAEPWGSDAVSVGKQSVERRAATRLRHVARRIRRVAGR